MTDPTAEVQQIVHDVLTAHHLFRAEPTVTPESSLYDLGVDDLDRIAISMRIEERWGFIVSDQTERDWTHVSDIIATVEGTGVPA